MFKDDFLTTEFFYAVNVLPSMSNEQLYKEAGLIRPRRVHPDENAFGRDWQYSAGAEAVRCHFEPGKAFQITKNQGILLKEDVNLINLGILLLPLEQAKDEQKLAEETVRVLEKALQWFERNGTERVDTLRVEAGLSDDEFTRLLKGKYAPYAIMSKKAELIREKLEQVEAALQEEGGKVSKPSKKVNPSGFTPLEKD